MYNLWLIRGITHFKKKSRPPRLARPPWAASQANAGRLNGRASLQWQSGRSH